MLAFERIGFSLRMQYLSFISHFTSQALEAGGCLKTVPLVTALALDEKEKRV